MNKWIANRPEGVLKIWINNRVKCALTLRKLMLYF